MSDSPVPVLNDVELVLRQALITYFGDSADFEAQMVILKRKLNQLTMRSMCLDPRLLHSDVNQLNAETNPSSVVRRRQTPVTYIKVVENQYVTAGVFVLREKARIPLHDHPFMYGQIKVLCGKIRVVSYSAKHLEYSRSKVTTIDVVKMPTVVVGPDDDPCMLNPEIGNIHQVEAVDGPAAFFDLLTPPYNVLIPHLGPRRCRFFKEVNNSRNQKLTVVSQHKGYWNDQAPYKGPRITVHAFQ